MASPAITTRDILALHLRNAESLARFEVANALTEPARKIVNIISLRHHQLKADEQELAAIIKDAEETIFNPEWGLF